MLREIKPQLSNDGRQAYSFTLNLSEYLIRKIKSTFTAPVDCFVLYVKNSSSGLHLFLDHWSDDRINLITKFRVLSY